MEFLRKFWANMNGYFWLPCPVCGRMFGGFEIADNGLIGKPGECGTCVCKKCNEEVLKVNKKNFEEGKIEYYFVATSK